MGCQNDERSSARLWALARRQHWVVTRAQLLELGFGRAAIEHRVRKGRLHPIHRGVYAVGRPDTTQEGRWMAAALACGIRAAVSHFDAAALWELLPLRSGTIHVCVPANVRVRRPGITVHQRRSFEVTRRRGVPVTTPVITLIDLASTLGGGELEQAINQADKLDLVSPDELRAALDSTPRCPGLGAMRTILDRRTFVLTDSQLERRFLPIARRAGLPTPQTGTRVNGFRVDFHWPGLGLVVETDGLRYHRTPAAQARDRVRDQAHTAAGLTTLRFTHAQVSFEPARVESTLAAVAHRLRG